MGELKPGANQEGRLVVTVAPGQLNSSVSTKTLKRSFPHRLDKVLVVLLWACCSIPLVSPPSGFLISDPDQQKSSRLKLVLVDYQCETAKSTLGNGRPWLCFEL